MNAVGSDLLALRQAFEQACSELGHKPVPLDKGWHDLYVIEDTLAFMVEKGQKDGRPMQLALGLIDAPSFNGWACGIGSIDVIGIFSGVREIAWRLFRALLSHGFLCPDVGDSSRCRPRVMKGATQLPTTCSGWPDTKLECPEREGLAYKLAYGVALHVAFHEIGHIYNGHIDYLQELWRVRRLVERSGTDPGGITRQTLEWDADMMSAELLLMHATRPRMEETERGYRWIIDGPGAFDNPDRSIGCAFLIAIALDYLLSADEDFSADDARERSRPPSYIRASYLLQYVPA